MPVIDCLPIEKNKSFGLSFSISVLMTAALAAGAIYIAATRYQLNQDVARAETSRIASSIASLQRQARNDLDRIAKNTEVLAAVAQSKTGPLRISNPESFARLLIMPLQLDGKADTSPLTRALEPVTSSLEAFDQLDITGSIQLMPSSAANIVNFDSDFYSIVATPLPTAGKPAALIGMQKVDDSFLATISREAGVGPIRLQDKDTAAENFTLIALGGAATETPSSALGWQSERPGDLLMLRWGLILLGGSILMAGLLIWHARRSLQELRRSEERARKLAGYDMLTGLPNRFLFTQLLDQEFSRSARGGSSFALLYFNIDRFREVNELLGHDSGDAVIVGATARIKSVLRPGDHLGRFGADEFAVLQTTISNPSETEELASRIMEAIHDPIDIGNHQVTIRLSGGIALHPQDAANRQDLMRDADEALTRAKTEGRNRFTFFQKRLSEDMRSRKTTEGELRKAIENSGLTVYYQPIMTVDGERVACVEALVRWPHPVRGLVPPDAFIALAEDRGLILPLGEFVLRQACRDGKRWPGVRVAVNVSPIQFRQTDFAAMVERILIEEQFEASQLELELTEGVVIADADQAESVMMDLRALGIRLALDDFGTGYSSLVYLRRFAFDKIKIDRSFLEAMEGTGESAIIVHSIIHLGRALGLTVTAEGIETAEQHRFLQAAGAHELQGYLFSKPVPGAEIDKILAAQALRLAGKTTDPLRSVA